MLVTFKAGAGSLTEFQETADFFRLMKSEGPATVYYYAAGREVARAEAVTSGYAERFGREFDRVAIASAAAQSIQFVTRLGNVVSYDMPPTGLVTVENTGGAFRQDRVLCNGSAKVAEANTRRRYLLLQNTSPTADMFVRLDGGSPASATNGVRISPGGALEFSAFAPHGAIYAHIDAPGDYVTVVEG